MVPGTGLLLRNKYFVNAFPQEFETLSEFIQKYYHATLTKRDMSLRGWNWGVADFVGECTLFKIIATAVSFHFLWCDLLGLACIM